eukprot:gnl/MRDRNA2_/MRDRNA2_83662_c0_seq1.p1 gnl/MRDRNA2_/MRDRNA2_83662_c0~~gnl/MRDRNA2_/MRDRNA2_83662_c0_seq1.p1  ORF type:complete len:113 (+),score=24.78 gnl/MRDRNA2_/MRDRNA2_83662_c0_seq1:104-442(+)
MKAERSYVINQLLSEFRLFCQRPCAGEAKSMWTEHQAQHDDQHQTTTTTQKNQRKAGTGKKKGKTKRKGKVKPKRKNAQYEKAKQKYMKKLATNKTKWKQVYEKYRHLTTEL